jgi:hypothetical protein
MGMHIVCINELIPNLAGSKIYLLMMHDVNSIVDFV